MSKLPLLVCVCVEQRRVANEIRINFFIRIFIFCVILTKLTLTQKIQLLFVFFFILKWRRFDIILAITDRYEKKKKNLP